MAFQAVLLNAIYGKALHPASTAPPTAPPATSLAAKRLGPLAPVAVIQQYVRAHGRRAGVYRVFWRRIANRGDGVVTAWHIEHAGEGGYRVWDGGREDPVEGMVKEWRTGTTTGDPHPPDLTTAAAADAAEIGREVNEEGEDFDVYDDYVAWATRHAAGDTSLNSNRPGSSNGTTTGTLRRGRSGGRPDRPRGRPQESHPCHLRHEVAELLVQHEERVLRVLHASPQVPRRDDGLRQPAAGDGQRGRLAGR